MLRDSGVRWRVAGLGVLGGQVGHAPFLSRPGELAGWVLGEVRGFGRGGGRGGEGEGEEGRERRWLDE